MESIVDLSVQEVNIHFLSHTQFRTDGPYATLHETLVHETKDFYKRSVDLGNEKLS